jgi:hypothetical protein
MLNARWRPISSALAIAPAKPTIVNRLADQVRRYPEMQPEDVYKFVHQAAFGNGHLMTDEATDRQYLVAELASVAAEDKEPLVDPVTPDGSIVRVNLRPFKARGLDVTKLGDAMIASAKRIQPDRTSFERWWAEVVQASSRRVLPFDAVALQAFASTKQFEGYPAVHHSAVYASRYFPAYRVVLRELAGDLVR